MILIWYRYRVFVGVLFKIIGCLIKELYIVFALSGIVSVQVVWTIFVKQNHQLIKHGLRLPFQKHRIMIIYILIRNLQMKILLTGDAI